MLDEADRLLDLGFENTLTEIIRIVDERRMGAVKAGTRMKVAAWPNERQIFLASATLKEGVLRLATSNMRAPVFVKESTLGSVGNGAGKSSFTSGVDAGETDKEDGYRVEDHMEKNINGETSDDDSLVTPTMLKQKYVVVPAKLRLVVVSHLFATHE